MCGILAIVGKTPSSEVIDQALDTLSKRGPDDRGILSFPNCTLAQTRLSIIDLSPGGHQPMKDNQKNLAITFNGEIYNYRELRASLEQTGHTFSSESDTEVILKTYLEHGEHCPEYLDGMFAFAIWDEEKQTLFMARDRFGKKPLYYNVDEHNTITVASEIKALFATGIRGKIDPVGIDTYLTLMYVPPWRTIYKNVQVLLPGHAARFSGGTLITTRYWGLKKKPIRVSYQEAKEEIRRLFTQAVQKRMVAADVEVGSFLSGGVDSTLVTAYAQRYTDHPIKTFSLGYGNLINELPYAEEASKVIGTDHYTLQANSDHIRELEEVMAYFDEPHGDSSNFPQHLVSGLASSKVKVALSGDGGDELFIGYGWYWQFWNRPKLVHLKNILVRATPFSEHLRSITQFPINLRKKLFKDPSMVGLEDIEHLVRETHGTGIDKINAFDITTYLPGQLLSKVDQTSMMHSLEVRCPFLDYQLAEYVANIPEEYRTDHTTGKIILKDLLSEIMPRTFVDRKKQGFGAPVRSWLQEPPMREYVNKIFESDARIYTLMNEEVIRSFIKKTYATKKSKSYYQLWVLVCLEVWMRKHEGTYEI